MLNALRRWLHEQPRWILVVFALLFAGGSVRFFAARIKHYDLPQVRIGADGRYHWAYLTSMALDHDLDFENQYKNPRSGNYYEYQKTPTGKLANPFTIGPAIAWMPFFAVGHGVSMVFESREEAKDGTSDLTQQITLYGSFLYAFGAMLLAYAIARRRACPFASLVGALIALFCGPMLQYTFNQPAYAHATSAFFVAATLFVWDRGREGTRSPRGWALLGALIGLAMMMRTQNFVFALPAVIEGGTLIWSARRDGAPGLARAAWPPLLGALCALLAFAPQMIAWHSIYGHWLGVPQGPGYMRWSEPLWADTLFSSRNGVFPYAPLWALGMIGLALLWKKDRTLFAVLLGTFALTAYLNGASSDWSGGGAFGGRRYDGLMVPVALGAALLVDVLLAAFERHPRRAGAVLVGAMVLLFGRCNYNMADSYRHEGLAPSASKDMLAVYNAAFMRDAKAIFSDTGNPLSWPGAWAFALRTGAPAGRYDAVVGSFLLTDFSVEQYRKRADKHTDTLFFGRAGHEKYLVRGFGAASKDSKTRPVGRRARFLVPLNHAGGVGFVLVGVGGAAETTAHIRWEGAEVATQVIPAAAPFRVEFSLDAATIARGVNVVDLSFDAAPDGLLLEKLDLTELP